MNAGQRPIMSDSPAPRPDNTRPARARRWPLWIAVILVMLALAGIGGRQLATSKLKDKIQEALGPNSEVSSIEVGFSSIEITGIRIRASKEWPAVDELSARRVVVKPDWGTLIANTVRVASIEVEDGYLSMLRRKDGKMVLLPSLLGTRAAAADAAARGGAKESSDLMPAVHIGHIELTNTAVDFFDASVRQPAHKLRLEKAEIKIGQILLPALTGNTTLKLDGVVKGVQRDGKISINGQIELASKDSEMTTRLSGVDLVAFQPYLIKAAETGVKKGALDLDLKSTVKENRLHAPGAVTLSGLELSSGKTFMGMPRDMVVSMMKNKDGKIAVKFTLEGNIDDPKFSLNENLSTRIGSSVAGSLGISLEGLARGVGSAGGSAAQGIGSTVGKLFGGQK
jgi:hypothetical protein